MILVEGDPRDKKYDEDGYAVAKLDLQVSTIAELPHLGDVIEGTNYKVAEGSIAQVIQADAFVTLDHDDTWYPELS